MRGDVVAEFQKRMKVSNLMNECDQKLKAVQVTIDGDGLDRLISSISKVSQFSLPTSGDFKMKRSFGP
jgi:hypothetical protein